jgi:hypothetical protein
MTQVTLTSNTQHPLRPVIESALANELRLLEAGIHLTEQRLQAFESRYGMTTLEFIDRYERDEITESLDVDEWVGEYRLLQRQQEKVDTLRTIRIDH